MNAGSREEGGGKRLTVFEQDLSEDGFGSAHKSSTDVDEDVLRGGRRAGRSASDLRRIERGEREKDDSLNVIP